MARLPTVEAARLEVGEAGWADAPFVASVDDADDLIANHTESLA